MIRPRALISTAAILLCTAGALAHVRLRHPFTGTSLFWQNPSNVGIVINSAGSDDLPDGSHQTALRMAIQEWNEAPGTTLTLVEDTNPVTQARTDWASPAIHTILFDEDGSTGVLSPGTVAVTLYSFDGAGRLTDADIIFNGQPVPQGFRFTTSGEFARFDVQDVAAHELGHLIGLDHSGWAGATMYPFVDQDMVLHRSLSQDEVHALRDAYPLGAFGRITGRILRESNGSPVAGAHVVARSAQRTVTSILTAPNGTFTLFGLQPGNYQVYAVPLGTGALFDAPVDAGNFGGGHTIQTDFATTFYPGKATIAGSETIDIGTLAAKDDVLLNLGTEFDTFPKRVVAGQTQTIFLRGTALNQPVSVLTSDPDFLVIVPAPPQGSQISFLVMVPAGEAPGHVDITITNLFGQTSVLPAALEVTGMTPTVTSVDPTFGPAAGGTPITITGTSFQPGTRVVVGDQVYTDGINGTAVIGPTTIALTTVPTFHGTHDVVVIDPTGIEGRLAAGFQAQAVPSVSNVFPPSGASGGGTYVLLNGTNFLSGATVRIGGIDQGPVTFLGPGQMSFTTTPGSLGTWPLQIDNPDGGQTSTSFVYTGLPDPDLSAVLPGSGQQGGGETITISGAGFASSSEVVFGADPETGMGGWLAASVAFVDSNTLEVVTPGFPIAGSMSVMVSEPGTGQADLLAAAFFVQPAPSSGGCTLQPFSGPPSPRSVLVGGWWLFLVLLVLGVRARRTCAPARG